MSTIAGPRNRTRHRRAAAVAAMVALLVSAVACTRDHGSSAAEAPPPTVDASRPEPSGALIWLHDGTRTWPPPLEAISMATGKAVAILPPAGAKAEDWEWSPDMQHAAWLERTGDGTDVALNVGAADGSGGVEVDRLPSYLDFRGRAFSTDGTRFAYAALTDERVELRMVDVATGTRTTIARWDDSRNVDVDWSPDGSRLVLGVEGAPGGGIFTMNPDGSGTTKISDVTAWWVRWSPDGSRIVAEATGPREEHSGVYVMAPDGSDAARLSPPGIQAIQPVFSPDGAWIAFASHRHRSPTTGVFIMRSNGTDIRQIVPAPANEGWAETWDWLPAIPPAPTSS